MLYIPSSISKINLSSRKIDTLESLNKPNINRLSLQQVRRYNHLQAINKGNTFPISLDLSSKSLLHHSDIMCQVCQTTARNRYRYVHTKERKKNPKFHYTGQVETPRKLSSHASFLEPPASEQRRRKTVYPWTPKLKFTQPNKPA